LKRIAVSIDCCTRCRLLAKEAMMIRRVLVEPEDIVQRLPTIRSDGVNPARSTFVESESRRSTPFLPSSVKAL
jgi:hypothetical protein